MSRISPEMIKILEKPVNPTIAKHSTLTNGKYIPAEMIADETTNTTNRVIPE